MSKSAIIEETKDDASMTDEDMNNEPVVDLGQVDPVSILIYSADNFILVTNRRLGVCDMHLDTQSAILVTRRSLLKAKFYCT